MSATITRVVRRGLSQLGRGRTAAVVAAAGLLLWWCSLVLGPDLPALLLMFAVVLVAVWMVRRRRAVAACVAISAGTAAAFAVTCVVVVDRQHPGGTEVVAVLIGYLLVTPVPALAACLQRPALVSAPVSALIGAGVLLAGAAPTVLTGAASGLDSVVLVTTLITAVAVIMLRHRRAGAKLTDPLPTVHGWTDLRGRRIPGGARVDQLLLGAGHAIVCTRLGDQAVTDRAALAAVRRAYATAQAIGLARRRVQPVILTTATEKDTLRRHLVNDGDVAASVIIVRPDQLCRVIDQAPARRTGHRRAVLAAALLPTTAPSMRERVR
jgi:hypothetical protein